MNNNFIRLLDHNSKTKKEYKTVHDYLIYLIEPTQLFILVWFCNSTSKYESFKKKKKEYFSLP